MAYKEPLVVLQERLRQAAEYLRRQEAEVGIEQAQAARRTYTEALHALEAKTVLAGLEVAGETPRVTPTSKPNHEEADEKSPLDSPLPKGTTFGDVSVPGVELHLHGRVSEMVEKLSQWQGISIADVIRKAITNEYFIQETLRGGGKILVETRDKKLHTHVQGV